jgi:hypothetical protein
MFPGLQSMPQVKCDVERVSHGSIEKFHEPKHDDGLIDATLTAINICHSKNAKLQQQSGVWGFFFPPAPSNSHHILTIGFDYITMWEV